MTDGLNLTTFRDDLYDWVNSFIQRDAGDTITLTWVEGQAGSIGVKDDVPAPQPAPPYVTMKLDGPFKEGADDLEYNSTGDSYTLSGFRRFIFSVQSFGIGAMQDLQRLQGSIDLPESQEFLRDKGIGIGVEPSVTDLTGIVQTEFEERAIIEIEIYVCHSIDSTVSQIRTSIIDYDLDGRTGQFQVN